MSVIEEFSIDEFWEAEDVYEKMLKRMKERATEIAIKIGKVYGNWITKDINLFCNDDEAEVLVEAILIKNRTKVEKACGLAEEKVVFEFPMDWLFYEDDEELENMRISEETQREKEYAEYLRLKEKFEK